VSKLIAGVGIYEKGRYPAWVDNKNTKEYQIWTDIHKRCQSGGAQQKRRPTYIGCSVHRDFIKFQDFAEWCQTQIGFNNDRWALDKDILSPDNKVYGPDTCVFVPPQLNSLLTYKKANQGDCPTGVYYDPRNNNYQSQVNAEGKVKYLGRFETPELAEDAYKLAKTKEIRRRAELIKDQIDPRAYNALMNYVV